MPTFVALIGAQQELNIAVLVDFQKKDQQSIENLYRQKLLNRNHVLTYADFTPGSEADVEDMFDPELYLSLVNGVYGSTIQLTDLPPGGPRVLPRIESYLKDNPLPEEQKFNHYRPARYFCDSVGEFASSLTDIELDRFQKAFDALNALL